ncbi:MAG: type II secretion system F family protein [Gammaproteobacteria bacterium]|nr:type II secretion system F family protein [Gammaproteobacteria bacterium]
MDDLLLIFIFLVFVAVFLFAERLLAVTVGPHRAEARSFKQRLHFISQTAQIGTAASLLRDAGLESRSPFDSWPGTTTINRRLRGSGYKITAGQVVLISVALGFAGFSVVSFLGDPLLAVVTGLLLAVVLPIKISVDYNKRMNQFEEGLVEALDVMTRSLKAGQPFNESMLTVAQELTGPVAEEFGLTFAELNYGLSPHQAFEHMLDRVPSVTLKALVVAVLLQRETGGNLAELLSKISGVLRGRFKFQRKVRTLSAEGRLSAVILIAVPFVLFGMIYLTTPSYVAELLRDPKGTTMIAISAALMVIGIIWVRKLTRLDV